MKAIVFALVTGTLPVISASSPASAEGLAINVKNSTKSAIFVYWDDSGRCAEKAKCEPFKGMKPPKNGLVIPAGSVRAFMADKDNSVQIGDSPTAHLFITMNGRFTSKEFASKTFSAVELAKDEKKAIVLTVEWGGGDLKVVKD